MLLDKTKVACENEHGSTDKTESLHTSGLLRFLSATRIIHFCQTGCVFSCVGFQNKLPFVVREIAK